jgi:hypothetical protein
LLVPANSEEIKKKQELCEQINSAAPASKQIPKGVALISNGEFIKGTTAKEAQKVCLKIMITVKKNGLRMRSPSTRSS